jgi:hypothetical protein
MWGDWRDKSGVFVMAQTDVCQIYQLMIVELWIAERLPAHHLRIMTVGWQMPGH